MWIVGINTGAEFENLMINSLRHAGMTVYDTPVSNDYGADMVIEYNGYRIAGQCKYYNKPVGVKAVQEVMGAIAYYGCDAGLVVTNQTFTQQAINLANANNILLFDETTLEDCSNDDSLYAAAFDEFFGDMDPSRKRTANQDGKEWIINDLVIRYGVTQQTIVKNFMGYGMPYYKVGREYRFSPSDVYWWEVDTHYVPYGRRQKFLLPGHVDYRNRMNRKIKKAKKDHDYEYVKKLKKLMKSHGVSRISEKAVNRIRGAVGLIIVLLPLLILLYMIFGHR